MKSKRALHRVAQQQQQQQRQRSKRRRWQQSNVLCPHAFTLPPCLPLHRRTTDSPTHLHWPISSVFGLTWTTTWFASSRRRFHLKLIARWAVSVAWLLWVTPLPPPPRSIHISHIFLVFFSILYFHYSDDGKFDLTSCSKQGQQFDLISGFIYSKSLYVYKVYIFIESVSAYCSVPLSLRLSACPMKHCSFRWPRRTLMHLSLWAATNERQTELTLLCNEISMRS